ncbi:hypothetical protein AB0F11_06270 [Streptomyces sp. NPDC032472]|uniref:hypothetical protein n=1 Tax=Streptomyces sp. NPDC032472 TaxID=3155018 RepID=UPI0033C7BE6A
MQRIIRPRLARFATPALVGLLALGAGPAAQAAGSRAPAAVPADATCKLVLDKGNSKPGYFRYAIKASEFTAGSSYSIIGIKHGGAGGKVSPQGTFSINKLGPGDYGVSTKEEGTVLCGHTPNAPNKSWQYNKAYNRAYNDVAQDCDADPPKNLNKQRGDFQQGYRDGMAAAKTDFCI